MYTHNADTTAQSTASASGTQAAVIGNGGVLAASHNYGGRFRGHIMGMVNSYSILIGNVSYYNGTNVIHGTYNSYSGTGGWNAMRITATNAIKGDVVIKAYY
jgi:hypothetical protein